MACGMNRGSGGASCGMGSGASNAGGPESLEDVETQMNRFAGGRDGGVPGTGSGSGAGMVASRMACGGCGCCGRR